MKNKYVFLSSLFYSLLNCSTSALNLRANNNTNKFIIDNHFTIPETHLIQQTLDNLNIPPEPVSRVCPDNMQLVDGNFCPNVEQRCLEWAPHSNMRCLKFAPSRCLSANRIHMRYCMNTYEGQNIAGEIPQNMTTWYQARNSCESIGKRLCTSNEWTFACEGEEMLPYSSGYERTQDCNRDHPGFLTPNRRLLGSLNNEIAMMEAKRISLAEPSGTRLGCVSPFGVHDMLGNYDEYTYNPNGSYNRLPYVSWLHGGDFRYVRTRCRATTYAHGPSFRYYNISWRCCSNARN